MVLWEQPMVCERQVQTLNFTVAKDAQVYLRTANGCNLLVDGNTRLCLRATSCLQVHERMAGHIQTSTIATPRPHHRLGARRR